MVGNHPHAHIVMVSVARLRAGRAETVGSPRHLLSGRDDRIHLIDLIHVGLVLQEEGEALQTSTGIDRGPVELAHQLEVVPLALTAHELVEDEVPDLQEAVSLHVDLRAPVRAVGGAAVVVDLAAGAGRSRLPRGPGDLLERELLDAFGRDPDDPGPVIEGDLILLPDRHPQAVAVQTVAALVRGTGQQVPGVVDRPLLEVIAEGEVAVHLEERSMPSGLADIVDVVGADALLHTGGPGPRRGFSAQDVGDERNHARHGEQDRGLRGDQGHGGTDLVVVRGEVIEPASTDLRGAHGVPRSVCRV